MKKTIDTDVITDEMIAAALAADSKCIGLGVTDAHAVMHDSILAALAQAPAVEPAQAVQSESCSNLMWATAKMREREHNRIGKMVGVLEQIKQEKLSALEQAQAVPPGYSLQAIAEFDAMNELIRSNDALTIAYMSGKHDQKAIDHGKKQRAIDFVRWVVSLQTGGLIQVRANELLNLLETENE